MHPAYNGLRRLSATDRGAVHTLTRMYMAMLNKLDSDSVSPSTSATSTQQWCSQGQNLKASSLKAKAKAWTFEAKAKYWTFEAKAKAKAIVPRPRPLSIRLPHKLRYAVRLTAWLSFHCFCLDIHLLLITCQLLLNIINLLSCFHSLCNCTLNMQNFAFSYATQVLTNCLLKTFVVNLQEYISRNCLRHFFSPAAVTECL